VGRAGEAFAPLEAEPSLPDLSRGGRASANEPPGGGRASAGDDFGAALDSSPGLIGDLWGIAQVGADEQPGGSAVAGEGARPLLAEGAAHAPARDGLLAVEDAQEEARPADLASVRPVSPPGPPQNLRTAPRDRRARTHLLLRVHELLEAPRARRALAGLVERRDVSS